MTVRAAVMSLVVAIAAGCSSSEEPPAPSPSPSAVTTSWSARTAAVNLPDLDRPAVQVEQELDFIAAQGFTAVRVPIRWSSVEPKPDQYDWTTTDVAVRGAWARGLQVLGLLTSAPSWAVDTYTREVTHPAPKDPASFGPFAAATATRYSQQISTWEIWNEPNAASTFGPIADVARYCTLLRAASSAIRARDGSATVIAGGTTPSFGGARDLTPANFVNGLFGCAAGSFDAVAMHPYSTPALLSRPSRTNVSAAQITAVHQVLVARGASNMKIWFTEFGAPTGPGGVSERSQSTILVDGITLLRAQPYAGPTFVFMMRDIDTGSRVPDYNYGLVQSDYEAKPALRAVLDTLRG